MDFSKSSFDPDSSSRRLSASWIRESSAQTVNNEVLPSSDIAVAQLAVMGLWIGRNCREITNNTDAIFRLDTQADSGGFVGQGYSASIINATNTIMVNNVSRNGAHVVRKHVRSWGLEGHDTAMDFLREVRVLTHEPIRKHLNIISLISFEWMFWPGEEPSLSPQLCLERSDLGDLASFQSANSLSYHEKRNIFLDIAHGLVALHDSGVVHGDIKSENVLIFEHEGVYQAKICDFGFAVFLADIKDDKACLLGGTIPWIAPEFRRELPYPHYFLKLTDVYSLGLLFWRVLLEGKNPFENVLLKDIRGVEQAKVANPPLLHYAQASIVLRPEYGPFIEEIWTLLAYTIQKNPLKRKLRAAIRGLSSEWRPISKALPQLSSNALASAGDLFNIRNICLPVRLRMMKHIRSSAMQMSNSSEYKFANQDQIPLALGVIDVAIGDGGLDLDDDPTEALKWITSLANSSYIPMQAVILRTYDYFDKDWPSELKQKANEYLANGVVNGSVTAALDYAKYWPNLEFQTRSEPESLFLSSRTFYGNGTGLHLSEKAFDIQDIPSLYQNMISLGGESPILWNMYGLKSGNTLLHACAMLGLPEVAEILISEFPVDINARNDNGDTPLLAACRNGKFPMAFKLVAKGARANISNINDETPLHWVLNIPDEDFHFNGQTVNKLSIVIDSLLYAGGDLEAQAGAWASRADKFPSLFWTSGTPLHRAVARRNLPAARILIQKGANPTSISEDGQVSPLDLAMLHHNTPMIRLILDNCWFNLNKQSVTGHTVYSRALSLGSTFEMIIIHGKDYPRAVNDTLDLLIARGFDVTCAEVDTTGGHVYELDALFVAVFYERLAWVQYFLSSKQCMQILDINRRQGEYSMTVLHQSIHTHRKSIFISLLDAGADPKLKCSTWSIKQTNIDMETTSLHLVAQQGDPDLFFTTRLLEYDLDIDAADFYGITPFTCAVIEGNLHIANALLNRGADINKRTGPRGGNPEHQQTTLARILTRDCTLVINRLKYLISGPKDVESALFRHGPAAEFMVRESGSALHVFLNAHKGREDSPFRTCLEVLLKAFSQQSQLDYQDDNHKTPLHIAASHGNAAAVAALLTAGATVNVLDGEGRSPTDLVLLSSCGKEKMKRIIDRLASPM
ncbi:hypothetical protein N7478_007012 [Penicillium angulare]|uniref:uncharacterized protein n=1 Tax=Penicillium angulare TaxID=116970 RepID=UPI00254268DA|nr:uncharacterized protein N7478_007012 [Penicillium angulare]KAJ5281640.1 hypothetical protein N7478_007012 [Penicillium angulare]